jgi:NLR family CARD domain-containing protein 3
LSGIGIKIEAFSALVELLEGKTLIQSFHLVDCSIGDQGVILISEAVKENEVLQTLALPMNGITDIGARAIAEILVDNNTTIKVLNLSSNKIQDKGVCAITQAISYNSTLEKIHLCDNPHVFSLIDMKFKSSTVKRLN